jgi:hypothetical protein
MKDEKIAKNVLREYCIPNWSTSTSFQHCTLTAITSSPVVNWSWGKLHILLSYKPIFQK